MSDVVLEAARRMTPASRLRVLSELERQIAGLQARQLALLAALDADPVTVSLPQAADRFGAGKNWAVEDVACALRLSPGQARSRLGEAVEAARMPRLLQLLAEGAVSMAHIRVATDQTMTLDDQAVTAVQDRVLARAPEQSSGAFRAAVRRAVLTVAAPSIDTQRIENLTQRRVCLRPGGTGTTELWALLPDEGAAALMSAISALATKHDPGDERTADQRRADALVQLGLDALTGQPSTALARRPRLRPAVQVSIALSTLLHLDNQPGELAGIGAITATHARQLAHDPTGTWRRLLTDPQGHLHNYGRSTYRPPAPLTQHIHARDRTCRFPHCTRPATRSDIDHTTPWTTGGTTTATNLTTLCPRHHHLRHDTTWTYQRTTTTGTTWTTPTGTTHTTPHATYPPDTTTSSGTDHSSSGTDPPPPF